MVINQEVKVDWVNDPEYQGYIGAKGTLVAIFEGFEYPYEVCLENGDWFTFAANEISALGEENGR